MVKPVNLLPQNLVRKIELKRITYKFAALGAVIFLSFVLFVITLDVSIGIVSAETDAYNQMLDDERFTESDGLAAEMSEMLARVGRIPKLDDLVEIETLNPDLVLFLSNVMYEAKSGEKFVSAESIIYNSAEEIELVGLALDRDSIGVMVNRLNEAGIFSEIDLPQITQSASGLRFRLILTAGV